MKVERKVVDLLVEQIECADIVVLNKDDRVDLVQRSFLKSITQALNPSAQVHMHTHTHTQTHSHTNTHTHTLYTI